MCGRVIERLEGPPDPIVAAADLNAESPLGDRRPKRVGPQNLGDAARQPQSLETGSGQNQAVVVAGGAPASPGSLAAAAGNRDSALKSSHAPATAKAT